MSFLVSTLVVLHIICWAVALGLYVAGIRGRVTPKGLPHAAAGALVLGLLAWIVIMIGGATGGHLWFTLKLLFAVVATVAAFIAQKQVRTNGSASAPAYHLIAVGILANIVVAVFQVGQ